MHLLFKYYGPTNDSNLADTSTNYIIMSCSGASDLGELSDKIARKFRDQNLYLMNCLAQVAADHKPLIETLQTSEILVIDGCNIDCGKKIKEEARLSNYQHIRLTDFGLIKGETPVTAETVSKLVELIKPTNAKTIIKPDVLDSCKNGKCKG